MADEPVLAIRGWTDKFTTSELSRKVKFWRYVPIPTNLGGERFRILMSSGQGREAFGIFIALCELAANLPERGVLADERGPLSLRSLEIKIGAPAGDIKNAIDILTSDEIGWLAKHVRTTSGEHPDDIRPNPTKPNVSEPTQTHPIGQNGKADSSRASLGLVGGVGRWEPMQLFDSLVRAGVRAAVANRIAVYASKFTGFDVAAEIQRLRNTKTVANPEGALVQLMCKHAGIDLDTRSMVGDLQAIVNKRRAEG